MIVLVTGGRDYRNTTELCRVLDDLHAKKKIRFLVHGGAKGADNRAHKWALSRGVQPVACEALWDHHGDKAGTLRNGSMLELVTPDLVVAFPGGRGTANMMRQAYDAGVEILDVEDL